MTTPPVFDIDPVAFHSDPYPDLARMRDTAPVVDVPQLGALLMTRRDDIFLCEKNVATFSSDQPEGLMTVLMGQNMMRKDGIDHMDERKQAFPSLSPRTVRDVWKARFVEETVRILDELEKSDRCDLVRDFAMPVSGHALRHVTGLTQLSAGQIDGASQAMIDGIGNYLGDTEIEKRCREATELLDAAVDEAVSEAGSSSDDYGLARVLSEGGQPHESIRANIKLAISGGQNEPRDAIAGTVWALLTHPEQLQSIHRGEATWLQAFEEYARWISPIGMSPRRIARADTWKDTRLDPESRLFFMFGSGNRDERIFDEPDRFKIDRDTSKTISFGAGPHFCAGAAVSRTLVADVALPLLFERFPDMSLAGDVAFAGWAFRGPLAVPVTLA